MDKSNTKTVPTPLTYRIDDFVRLSGIGRTMTYEALRAGKLKGVKSGTRTLITAESAKAFIESLPAYASKMEAA